MHSKGYYLNNTAICTSPQCSIQWPLSTSSPLSTINNTKYYTIVYGIAVDNGLVPRKDYHVYTQSCFFKYGEIPCAIRNTYTVYTTHHCI